MTTVIEIRQEEVPPNTRCSLVVDGEALMPVAFCLANTIETQFAGVWLSGRRMYDTEVWWVPLEGERLLSVYVPPQAPGVDYSYDQLEEAQHGPT